MRHLISTVLAFLTFTGAVRAQTVSPVKLDSLSCEHLNNPIGIGAQTPRLSWKLRSDRAGEAQTAYEIRAATSRDALASRPDLWESKKINSDQSVLVPWAGNALTSRAQVFWQVRVWDKDDRPSAWSDVASFELGLLDSANEWKGKWITADLPRYDIEQNTLTKASWINGGSIANEPAAVRFVLRLPAGAVVRNGVIDAAADGLVTVYVNGRPSRPGFSSRTAPLHADVRARLVPGTNIIAISSAPVRQQIRRDTGAAGRNAIAAHGVVELEGGPRLEFNTDGSWKAAIASGSNWTRVDFDDSAWKSATNLAPYAEQPSKYADHTIGPGRYLRKNFTAKGPVARARLYATALGTYEASINGQRVNHDSLLDPGWTDYRKRVMVQTYDVTQRVRQGPNAIGAVLADGWYAGRVGWMGVAQYGARPVFSAQLELTYADGSTEIVATDDSWKAAAGEIIGSDQQWGEILDARKAIPGWDTPVFKDDVWARATLEDHKLALDPQRGPPVRQLLELTPQKITRRGDAWIVDLGQNMVGFVRLTARGPAGTTITVHHAEMLDADGSIYTENLRPALATDTFILKGSGAKETFEPHFTFHGFRYVEVAGYPGELTANDLRGIVVGSDTPPTGTWECSEANLNRLYENIVWGQRGNFLSVPTDCPQRDERMGWMGDAQVFAPTAARIANVAGFFTKWMVDVNDAQGVEGEFSTVSPRANQNQSYPVWGDAGVIIPWAMYVAYGDRAFLEKNYPSMTRWLEYSRDHSSGLIRNGGVGDHLAPKRTPVDLVDTAYFANSARIVARAAALLGKRDDSEKYEKLHSDIAGAFDEFFILGDGTLRGDTQTAYLLPLQFDLLPENLRADAARRLAANVETNGHLTTGFVGVGVICPVLTQIGRPDLAWKLVLTDTYPSWLFSVKNGATTIWERWDGWTPERGFQDSSMNSFNHYSFGSVGAWFYSGAAGIQPDEEQPGYKHFFLRPQFTTRVAHVKATLESPYGLISSHWHVEKDQMLYDVVVPPNTTAELFLPVPAQEVRKSGVPLTPTSESGTHVSLSAGTHHFSFARRWIE